jgi:cytoskeletal protein CcmA (bactofilin family)
MTDEQRDTGSLLGRGSEFSGKLAFFGTVRIEGSIEGEILSDDTLVVADGGEVKGTVEVGTLIITGGTVEAKVKAKKAVEIHAGGRLVGEVSSPVFQIDRGAIFQGVSSMPDEPTKSEIEGPGS